MIKRTILIGEWVVDLLICYRGYDQDGILACLRDAGASRSALDDAVEVLRSGDEFNYTFTNRKNHRAVVLTSVL